MNQAIIHSICVNKERGKLKHEIETALFLENKGIEGDGHCGDWGRQVTCLNWDNVVKSNAKNNLQRWVLETSQKM